MPLELYLAYVAACVVIVVVPGPIVTLVVANSITHGTRAGLVNIAGAQLGLATMIGIVLVGLASLISTVGLWFDWLRLVGAAYLIWLGWKLLRAASVPIPKFAHFCSTRSCELRNQRDTRNVMIRVPLLNPKFANGLAAMVRELWVRGTRALADPVKAPRPRIGFFWQGFLVLMSNPKALILFGAFIPQFVDPTGDYVGQVILLGLTFMVIASIGDSAYAFAAGHARALLPRRVRLVSRLSGGLLIGGGIWMALARGR